MLVTESFHGFIETTQDVLLIFEGCRRGLLPRICRRLQERERKMIRSGSVFVFDQRESGIKRWTDGRVWSPSRILGNFLIYRELDKRNPGDKKMSISSSTSLGSLDERRLSYSLDGITSPTSPSGSVDHNRERQLVGSLSDTYKFRQDGLIKKTMSIVVNGVTQHLISYYDPRDVLQNKLRTPSSVPELASLEISPELLVKQNFRIPPMVEPTFDHTDGLSNGPLSPPDSLSGSLDRRIHPLRSMSLGSVRQDMNTSHNVYSNSYQPPGQRIDGLKPEHSPTISNFVQPALPVPTNVYNAFSSVQSPTSLSSSPSTPMLSPARGSFQHQRHYSTSSASSSSYSSSIPRFDPRHYSVDYTPSSSSTTNNGTDRLHQQQQSQHPHHQVNQMDILSDNNNNHNHNNHNNNNSNNNYDQRDNTSSQQQSQHHTANLGQLLNPVHPLQNESMNSMAVSHHPHHTSSFTDYNSGYQHDNNNNKDHHPYHQSHDNNNNHHHHQQQQHHHHNNNDNNGSSGFIPIRYPMANQHHSTSLDSLYAHDTLGGVHTTF